MTISKALITWLLAIVMTTVFTAAAAAALPPPVSKPGVQGPVGGLPGYKGVILASLPDLVVSKVTFTPANPTNADDVFIVIEIKNQGTAPANFPGGTFWLANLPNSGGVGQSKTMCLISPGETVMGGIQLAAAGKIAPGTYAVTVVADPDNKVVEANKTNNQSIYNLVVAAGDPVDLIISDIQVQPLVGSTNKFNVVVTVKNNGAGKAVFPSGSQVLNSPELGNRGVAATTTIAGGTVYQLYYDTASLPAGPQTWHFYVDPGNVIKETDKGNNSRSHQVIVAAASGSGQPDLVVSKVTFTPANPTNADDIFIVIEIKNQGTAPANFPGGTFWLANLPNSGGVAQSKTMRLISPGETVMGGIQLAAAGKLAPGTYAVTVVADPDNKVVEANKTNNQSIYNLVVAAGDPVDLIISDIQVQPLVGSTNKFNVVVTVKNNGAGKAVFPSGSQVLNSPELGNRGVAATTTIAGGTVYQLHYETASLPAGPQTWHFYVDPGNVIKETDKGNNSRSYQIQIP